MLTAGLAMTGLGGHWAGLPFPQPLACLLTPNLRKLKRDQEACCMLATVRSHFQNPLPVRVSVCEFGKSSQPPSEVGAIFHPHFIDVENQGTERINKTSQGHMVQAQS